MIKVEIIKKLLIASFCAVLSAGAFAEDMPPVPADAPNGEFAHHGRPKGFGMMAKLTDEQKACIEKFGCKMPEKPEFKDKPDMPKEFKEGEMPTPPQGIKKTEHHKRPEMTEEQKENMECIKKAMESCGIEIPKRPEKPQEPKPE